MKIDFADIVLLNAELKKRNTRYHVASEIITGRREFGFIFLKMNCIFRVRRVCERFLVLCFLFCKTLLRLGVLDRCGELLEDIFSTKVVLFRQDGDE